jgi:hypothetical protein
VRRASSAPGTARSRLTARRSSRRRASAAGRSPRMPKSYPRCRARSPRDSCGAPKAAPTASRPSGQIDRHSQSFAKTENQARKKCRKCGVEKNVAEFQRAKCLDGLSSWCAEAITTLPAIAGASAREAAGGRSRSAHARARVTSPLNAEPGFKERPVSERLTLWSFMHKWHAWAKRPTRRVSAAR